MLLASYDNTNLCRCKWWCRTLGTLSSLPSFKQNLDVFCFWVKFSILKKSSSKPTSKINGKGDYVLGTMVFHKLVTKEKKVNISKKHWIIIIVISHNIIYLWHCFSGQTMVGAFWTDVKLIMKPKSTPKWLPNSQHIGDFTQAIASQLHQLYGMGWYTFQVTMAICMQFVHKQEMLYGKKIWHKSQRAQ